MNKLFDSIKQGLNEAIKFAEGDSHWEPGDRLPHGPALALLNLIQKDPAAILKVITQ